MTPRAFATCAAAVSAGVALLLAVGWVVLTTLSAGACW